MEFIDLKAQHQRIHPALNERFNQIFKHGQYILGPEVYELEKELANYVDSKHCITVANGTDALLIAMMALDIGPGDEVITSTFSFIATAEMIRFLGAKPVFVDIDPVTYNLDPTKISAAITKNTKAIVPVDLFGQCADYTEIMELAKQHKINIIEDAAQSFGATYKTQKACNIGEISCTSFFPSKPLGCYGDGGACFTNDDQLAEKIRQIANHGQQQRYLHTLLGMNSRLDTLQAAVLLEKLKIFPQEFQLRQEIAGRYQELLRHTNVKAPYIGPNHQSAYAQFTIRVIDRSRVREELHLKGIPTAVHYPSPLHLQPVFNDLNYQEGSFPHAEHAAATVLSLPMHPYLTLNQQVAIVDALKNSCMIDNHAIEHEALV